MASDDHGGTLAAWTAVAIIIGGCLVSAIALPFASELFFFVGLGIVVIGVIVGKVMSMMGLGTTVAYKDQRDPDYEDDEQQPQSDARS